ncbi:MAG: protein phosphatase 2C domain-containing protein [Pseudomonadales bacterium]
MDATNALSIFGETHTGNRKHNEDYFEADAKHSLAIVADGMGGYAGGEVASGVCKILVSAVQAGYGLAEAIGSAHAAVKKEARLDADKEGMGSTVVALKAIGSEYTIAWVGDSRAYLWDGDLKQLTCDHSYVEELFKAGVITAENLANHPEKNAITQAVGVAGQNGLDIGLIEGRIGKGEQILLCSDGLTDEVPDVEIAQLLARSTTPQSAVDSLVAAAVEAGGHDNITVVLVTANKGDAPGSHPDAVATSKLSGETVRHHHQQPLHRPKRPIQPIYWGLGITTIILAMAIGFYYLNP